MQVARARGEEKETTHACKIPGKFLKIYDPFLSYKKCFTTSKRQKVSIDTHVGCVKGTGT